MEQPPRNNEMMSEAEIAKMLLEKYPGAIKSIETFDPHDIEINGIPLPEIEEIANEKITDPFELDSFKKFVAYLYAPKIIDNFPLYRNPERHNFIDEITKGNEELKSFFRSNKFKLANPRLIAITDQLLPDLPENLKSRSKDFAKEILPTETYDQLSLEEKINVSKRMDEFCKDLIVHYLEKYK